MVLQPVRVDRPLGSAGQYILVCIPLALQFLSLECIQCKHSLSVHTDFHTYLLQHSS